MKALIKQSPEPGALYVSDAPIPDIRPDEVLVKVHVAAICGTDMHIYHWTEYAQQRLKLPMVFGHEFAGEIVKAGDMVSNYKVGDRVAGETHIPCNRCYQCKTGNQHICENMKIIGVQAAGAFAEYIPVPMDCLWKLDDSMDYETGALLEPMGVGVHGVLSGEIGGKTAVILGCGPIGLFAVAAAKACGASHVFAVDITDPKLALATDVGADTVINSRKEDAVGIVLKATGGLGADVVIDYTGNGAAVSSGFKMLRKGGRFTMVGLFDKPVSLDLTEDIVYKEARVNGSTGRLMYRTWFDCSRLLTSGKVDAKKIISGRYPLSEYKAAFADIESGLPGKILLFP